MPTAENLNVINSDFCANVPTYSFSWTYDSADGKNESRYQLQVDDNSNFSSPEIDLAINRDITGLSNPPGTVNSEAASLFIPEQSNALTYSKTYYFRVQVWDEDGRSSGWTVYQDNIAPAEPFSTPTHHYPDPDFTWLPSSPAAQEIINFQDTSTPYGGSSIVDWDWDFGDAGATPPTASGVPDPATVYPTSGERFVTLGATDSSGYFCETFPPISVTIGATLPKWKEIIPR